jgi:SAM-dependent methyltransferase
MSKLNNNFQKENFKPSLFGLFRHPFYFIRKGLYENILQLTPRLNGKLLDIGCGTKPYQDMCNVNEYIGLEIDDEGNRNHSYADVFYAGKAIPFDDNTFDSVLSSEVFEHVFNPDEFLQEVNRVTKMGGLFLITVPFIWAEHEKPYDYARYSSFGLKHILSKNGFEVIEHRKSGNGAELIFQLINHYPYGIVFPDNKYVAKVLRSVSRLIRSIIRVPVNIIGLILSKVLPRNDDLYLNNIVLAKKIRDME